MENKFKKLLQSSKAWQEGTEPLGKTFEGALFKETSWPFAFSERRFTLEPFTNKISSPHPKKSPGTPDIATPPKKVPGTVLFLGDTYGTHKGKEDLLGKMILAMKLGQGEYARVPFDEALEDVNDLDANQNEPGPATIELYKKILEHRPEIIVSLGATVTNVLLGKREKLSTIHGQFIEKTIALNGLTHSFSLMPLFHPEFLMINPNMKRTAWIDLQKVMERVGKI